VDRIDNNERPVEGDDRGAEDARPENHTEELPDEDVQVGPELTDRPKAGSTEPPD
jgi:hypothetical protein